MRTCYTFLYTLSNSTGTLIKRISLLVTVVVLLNACKKNEEQPVSMGGALVITASTSKLILNQHQFHNTAIEFNWTTGSNKGTSASISYKVQIDKKGNRFSAPVNFSMGQLVYNQKIPTGLLNDTLIHYFKFTPGVSADIEVRVIGIVASQSVRSDTSVPVVITVTPYQPVSNTLYLIGDATPNGWDNNNATPLQQDANDPTTFVYQGILRPGEFKFLTTLGRWLPSYQKGADSSHLLLRTDFSQPDDKFKIDSIAVYTVTVNILDLSITVVAQAQPATPPYNRLWIVGDATPNGWNINSPNEMRLDSSDPFIFTYNEVLKAGEFKIPTKTGNWGSDYYMPDVNHPNLSDTKVVLTPGGSPDNKWLISQPGAYKIKLDLRGKSIIIKPFTPYTKLWMVGDATPNGWNIDAPNPMTPDPTDPNVFTYTGPLKVGEFKIPTKTGNWGGDYFMPVTPHPDISSPYMKFVPNGSPDNKWYISKAGNYIITINQLYETISIQPQ